jgi:tyrosine-protein kinase Etk/Wzc
METVRSLRTSLQFALVESPNNVVAMTGPTPGVGKSFLAVNLAQVVAAAGRKVLLVDCDLRRGGLHRQFGVERKPGLSDVVSGAAVLGEAIQKTATGQLFVLPTGRIPPNPAELLSSHRFEALIQEVSARFDLILVDTPPLLAVTDAMLVARFAGVNFLVLRAGMHTGREIALAIKQFTLNGIKLHGTVLNDVRVTRTRYGKSGYAVYEYKPEAGE